MLLDLSFSVSEQRRSKDMLARVLLHHSRLLNTPLRLSMLMHNMLLLERIELADTNREMYTL